MIRQIAAPAPANLAEEFDVLCDGCGYSLLTITTATCPECGRPFDPTELPLARVPWLHRKRLGTWPAFLRTVRMILLSPHRFVYELGRPVRVSPRDAQQFRRICIRIAAVCAALAAGGQAVLLIPFSSLVDEPMEGVVLLIGMLVTYFAVGMFVRLSTDLPVFIWENRHAVFDYDLSPVQQYASAPLALAPIAAVLTLPMGWLYKNWQWAYGPQYMIAMTCLAMLAGWAIWIWAMPVILMHAASRRRIGRVLILSIYLPIHYLTMAAITFAVMCVAFAGVVAMVQFLLKDRL